MTSSPTATTYQHMNPNKGKTLTYGHRNSHELSSLKCWTSRGHEVAQQDANDHSQQDPYCKKLVENA